MTSQNFVIIGSGNGLLPVWCHAVIWSNCDYLSIRPLRTNYSKIWRIINNFPSRKCIWKSLQNDPFCSDLNVLQTAQIPWSCVTYRYFFSGLLVPWHRFVQHQPFPVNLKGCFNCFADTSGSTDWLTDLLLTDWLTDWLLTDWLTDWRADWLDLTQKGHIQQHPIKLTIQWRKRFQRWSDEIRFNYKPTKII